MRRVYHYLEAKWALEDIRRRRLKISKIDDMNDPYEWACVRSHHKPSQRALDKTKREIVGMRGALCFSRSRNSILMWSHYGEKHKGICLGFAVPDEPAVEETYVEQVELVGDLGACSTEERVRILDRLEWCKYEGWSYEEEVRVGASRAEIDEETGMYFVNFDEHLKLKEVIAGARFPMSKRPIEDALSGYEDVKIAKAVASPERFEIIIDERGFDLRAA